MPSFALLDDSHSTATQATSRLYTEFVREIVWASKQQFSNAINELESALAEGYFALAAFSYELGAQLQEIDAMSEKLQSTPSRILLYRTCQKLSQEQVTEWLQAQLANTETASVAGIANLRASVDEAEFTSAIERIQHYIAAGDTYQVNYTFRFHFETYGSIFALDIRLRERQAVPYGALIALPDGSAILSLSPELFVRHQKGTLYARPMKGTAAASATDSEEFDSQLNTERSQALSTDNKNRAENVMIVDLLRNDLSRIAQLGSVRVPQLFEVQRFNSVLQMTSTITAQCRAEVNLEQVLRALYPCGSITGAPKLRTMEIIDEVETEPRGMYTGALGWFDPHPPSVEIALPDFCLSVPIRTLQLTPPDSSSMRQGVMGVGAGIVFDSVAADEYQESLLKARFLTTLPAQFALFETMYATREDGCRQLDRHLRRLQSSARYFGIAVTESTLQQQLETYCANLPVATAHRLKLSLNGVGEITIQSAVLAPMTEPVKVLLAAQRTQSNDLWLQHKTTLRADYDHAWQQAETQGAFDMLFCNELGEVTEGGRTNVFAKLDGKWYTPPLCSGVLQGVMRSVLLDDPTWLASERKLTIDDIERADELVLCNALRGVMKAVLIK